MVVWHIVCSGLWDFNVTLGEDFQGLCLPSGESPCSRMAGPPVVLLLLSRNWTWNQKELYIKLWLQCLQHNNPRLWVSIECPQVSVSVLLTWLCRVLMRMFCLSSFSCWSRILSIRSSMRLFWASSISWKNKTKRVGFKGNCCTWNTITNLAHMRVMGDSLTPWNGHHSKISVSPLQPTVLGLCNSFSVWDFPSQYIAFQADMLLLCWGVGAAAPVTTHPPNASSRAYHVVHGSKVWQLCKIIHAFFGLMHTSSFVWQPFHRAPLHVPLVPQPPLLYSPEPHPQLTLCAPCKSLKVS